MEDHNIGLQAFLSSLNVPVSRLSYGYHTENVTKSAMTKQGQYFIEHFRFGYTTDREAMVIIQ